MEVNQKNKNLYDYYLTNSITDNCKCPEAAAFTDLIKNAILNKDYIFYNGGGPYNENNKRFIKQYDVVVIFSLANDPEFMVVTDEDGDICVLFKSNNTGNLISKFY